MRKYVDEAQHLAKVEPVTLEQQTYDAIVVGAGIAGSSFAYFAAKAGSSRILIIEREAGFGHHASGRSAETLYELDPIPTVQRLKRLGGDWLRNPPADFSEHPLLDPTGALGLFDAEGWANTHPELVRLAQQGMRLELCSPEQAARRVPLLNPDAIAGAAWMPEAGALDVYEWHSSYLKHARQSGVQVLFDTEVTGVLRAGGRCVGVRTSRGSARAPWVVNAAGAWASPLACMAEASHIPITPKRRSAIIYEPPGDPDMSDWPLVVAADHRLYFQPKATGLLFCPMDEQVMAPCDAQPNQLAIAEGVERLRQLAPNLVPKSIKRSWGGLRSFAPDGVAVVGEDPACPGFFWLAGQGGCGIETSPILGPIAADLILEGRSERFETALLSPKRFLEAGAF